MMGRKHREQASLFYEFRLDDMIPKGHLLRRINVFVTSVLGDLHEQLGPLPHRYRECRDRMPRSSFDREAVQAEIDRIRSLGLDELRSLWRATFRTAPPPGFTKDLIARFLCWHIQEQTGA